MKYSPNPVQSSGSGYSFYFGSSSASITSNPKRPQEAEGSDPKSNRILVTASAHAKKHFLYVQETGSLRSTSPHISSRENLNSLLFLIVTSGSGTLIYDGESRVMQEGDCAFIDCRIPYSHESSLENPWTLKWVHFYGSDVLHFLDSYKEQGLSHVFHPAEQSSFINLLTQIYDNCKSQGFLEELENHRCLTELIAKVFSSRENDISPTQNKMQQIRSYMEHHLKEKLTLDSLAEHFFISKYHLSREYHRTFGTTLITDLNALRISSAKSDLRFTDHPVEEIAEKSGFNDSAYFVHVFKIAEGITPLQYRKHWRSRN